MNPRFSGGLALTLAAGADLVGEFVRATVGERMRPRPAAVPSGVTMTRHYSEIIAA